MQIVTAGYHRLLHAQWCVLWVTFAVSVFLLWGTVEEDSYIFFRVARNIAEGYGYVFNRGGEHIETGSSPLWQMLLAAVALTPFPMITLAKLMGSVSAAFCLWHSWKIERLFGNFPVLFSPWLLGTSITFLFWSQSGMETVFFELLVILWIRSLLDASWHRHAAWIAVLLYAGRPEGFIYIPAMLLACLVVAGYRPYFFRHAFCIAIGISIFHACRWWYFDDVFPSAFYAKSDFYPVPHWNLYKTYLTSIELYWLFPAMVFGLLNARVMVIFWIFFVACYFAAGNPDGKILFRLGMPAVASACLLAGIGMQLLYRFVSGHHFQPFKKPALVFALLSCSTWTYNQITFSQSVFLQQQDNPLIQAARLFKASPAEYARDTLSKIANPELIAWCNKTPVSLCEQNNTYNDFGAMGEWLHANRFPGMVVAGDQMGEIPWTSGQDINHLDLFGITDKCIGYANFSDNVKKVQGLAYYEKFLQAVKRNPVCNREDAIEHFFSVLPDVIFMGTIMDQFAPDSFYGKLKNDPRFQQVYSLRYFLDLASAVYVKKALPEFSIPDHLMLLDAQTMRIPNCPPPALLRIYLQQKLSSGFSDEQAGRIEEMCQR